MKTSSIRRLLLLSLATVTIAAPAWSTCGGGGGGGDGGMSGKGKVYEVPWSKIHDGESLAKDGLTVFWFPASSSEIDTSPLKNSRPLSMYATECVSLDIADATSEFGKKYISDDTLPVVVLATPDGTSIGKLDSKSGPIAVEQVETLVAGELKKREDDLRAKLDAAREKAKGGDKDAAVAQYKAVLEQKCMFPRLGKEAVKELKKLGVTETATFHEQPKFDKATNAQLIATMAAGWKAENAGNYVEAARIYEQAHQQDPNDPVPLRYLGETYRHHIGDWVKATKIFNQILAMHADPLSQAVALHGLGKITIHEGQFKKGLSMMEKSLSIYPLALTCRNLAVYWNSEGDKEKADKYTKEALALEPHETYNLVFATALLAGGKNPEDALKVAKENQALMPASYNLAAIYAQNGQKDKALAMLKRHFYQYERFQAVRSKEMMEARVDAVFASLVNDPRFLALTSGADNKLPFKGMSKVRAQ